MSITWTSGMRTARNFVVVVASAAAVIATAAVAQAMSFDAWSPAVNAEIEGTSEFLNTDKVEGCAFVAQRDDVLYFASNRTGEGSKGGLDIWYSTRKENGAWDDPVNFEEVNSTADDMCPTAHRNGKTFLFVSSRVVDDACGGGDIYVTRLHATRGWAPPQNLGCTVNSSAEEAGPYLLEDELYFSSSRAGGFASDPTPPAAPDSDVYVSIFDGASFATPTLAPGLNTAQNDNRPNLRRDGLEIFFDSNRTGSIDDSLDLWTSTRTSTSEPWSDPTNLRSVNSGANDLRPTLSWDGTTLYFGSFRTTTYNEGKQDLYVTTREQLR